MKGTLLIVLLAACSTMLATASTIPDRQDVKQEHCSAFKDSRVKDVCKKICQEYGEDPDYILGQCGQEKGICECKKYKQ
ncbi:hypothetical protein BDB00DRAFT_801243 [Zychaea mexicana]|uniref:uncharacterized protein n=1 Tax=Zychaea mexicana TaxID=64656 RepID=UPI0022FE885F|nr:uncharacterized protein BDB00DRAFT_801243 [Zychaea mexicana]KAI9498124.1 hypothetical protein BDB00DRAFT_801243 [Zychaea mexicana]